MKKILSILLLSAMLMGTAAGCAKAPASSDVLALSASADKYAGWLANRIDEGLGEVIICDSADAEKYSIDLSDFQAGGYTIRKQGDSTVIAGKDDAGLDAAVRYFAKYATSENMSVTEGEGYRVKSVTVDGHDISEYTIYVPAEIPAEAFAENVDYAADVLIAKLAEACGVTLAKTNELGGRQIVFAYDGETYGEEAFNINISDGNITITGGTSRGPLYGAYGFLEECIGYRFLTRGVVYLYEADLIVLENGYDHTEGNTPFKWRDTYTHIDGKTHLYPAGPLHSDYKESVISLHNTGTWVQKWLNTPKYGYGEGPDTNHSAYKLIPSIPDPGTPCFSDPEIFDECVANLRIYIKDLLDQGFEFGSTMPKISISQNDTEKWCGCPDCMETISQYGSYSSNLIDFISRVSEELEPDYPEIEFWMLAYHTSTTKPPVNMEVPENLTICFCHYLACNNHSVTGVDCTHDYTKEIAEHFRNWFKVTDNVEVWYYACHFNYSLAPAANLYQIKKDVQYYADMGVKGFFMQNEETTLGFDDLSSYLSAELLWNPYMTDEEYEAKIEEFCRIFYGDGYELIAQYTKDMEEAGDRNDCWSALSDAPFRIYNYDFMSDNFDHFVELFETAISLANTAEQEARLKRLSCHMYFNCIAAQHDDVMANGTDAEKALLTERYQLLYDRLYEIRDVIMFGIFTEDTVPEVFDPTLNPIEWLTQNNSSWGDMMD